MEPIECCNCGKVLEHKDDMFRHDGEVYCEQCYDELGLIYCDKCGEPFLKDELTHLKNGNYYCDKCAEKIGIEKCSNCRCLFTFDEGVVTVDTEEFYCNSCSHDYTSTCDECGSIVRNYLVTHDQQILCDSCYEENYFTCEDCGEIFDNDHAFESQNGWVCENCYHPKDESIHQYSYKPLLNFLCTKKDKPKRLFMGVELEVELLRPFYTKEVTEEILNNFSKDERLFYLKEDGSLNNGFEVVTHPCTLYYHKENFPWENLLFTLRKNTKSHNTTTCGLHIHVSKNYFKLTELIKLGLFVYKWRRNIEIFSRRVLNSYCCNKDIKTGKKSLPFSKERYEAVNYKNTTTIEFRMFKGTLRFDTLIATLEFVHSLSHFVKTVSSVKIMENGWTLWKEYISSPEFKELYKELRNYCNRKAI